MFYNDLFPHRFSQGISKTGRETCFYEPDPASARNQARDLMKICRHGRENV